MSAAEWKKIQEKEKKQRTGKNFGAGGARGFKSRSFNSFVDAMERGEATHLFAVNPDLVRKGEIALKDVPYMQRGGSWDNSDLKGKKGWMKTGFGMTAYNDGKAEQKRELASDKKYNNIKPDIGFFGEALNWGGGAKGDDLAARAKRNGLTNDQQLWRDSGALSQQEIKRMELGPPHDGRRAEDHARRQKAPEARPLLGKMCSFLVFWRGGRPPYVNQVYFIGLSSAASFPYGRAPWPVRAQKASTLFRAGWEPWSSELVRSLWHPGSLLPEWSDCS